MVLEIRFVHSDRKRHKILVRLIRSRRQKLLLFFSAPADKRNTIFSPLIVDKSILTAGEDTKMSFQKTINHKDMKTLGPDMFFPKCVGWIDISKTILGLPITGRCLLPERLWHLTYFSSKDFLFGKCVEQIQKKTFAEFRIYDPSFN